jgi:hypothetical protein
MPPPHTILIDTSIFDQQAYNFSSPTVVKFLHVARARKLILILPDVIEREVKRHIKDKSREALKALRRARHDAPFLAKWTHWPANKLGKAAVAEIEATATADWEKFLSNFKVEKLGYGRVDMNQVMDWYDQQQAPFGEGEKRKEFPDAFAIAAAVAYAKSKKTKVAVVSKDFDYEKACALHPELLYLPDLPTATEDFMPEMKPQIDSIKRANKSPLLARICRDFPDLAFYPEEDPDGDVSDVEVEAVKLTEIKVLEIQGHECTVAFSGRLRFSAFVSYDDPDTMIIDSSEDIRIALHRKAGTVTENTDVSGTVTLEFDDGWTAIVSVSHLEFDSEDITVKTAPEGYEEDAPDDPPDEPPEPPEPPKSSEPPRLTKPATPDAP